MSLKSMMFGFNFLFHFSYSFLLLKIVTSDSVIWRPIQFVSWTAITFSLWLLFCRRKLWTALVLQNESVVRLRGRLHSINPGLFILLLYNVLSSCGWLFVSPSFQNPYPGCPVRLLSPVLKCRKLAFHRYSFSAFVISQRIPSGLVAKL